ncbi:pentapeptide repeat-containing protein [Stackebrandtia soli]|uniref:pentapeptide repeat-containing protein n=1 Tax=Stackebrandtia soli TaxID=1892856 RepID=UPI0039ECEF2B
MSRGFVSGGVRRVLVGVGWLLAGTLALAFIGAVGWATWQLINASIVDGSSSQEPPAGQASGSVEEIRTVLTAMVGAGGLITLIVMIRKQWSEERTSTATRHDADERRITDLYSQAVEQIGHEKAPVRLGGLIALDRLGRNHPAHRQDVVDVFCAYLRMPYTPPAPETTINEGGPWYERSVEASPADEHEVRATAQRLLAGHLKDPRTKRRRLFKHRMPKASATFWTPDLTRIDLTAATLIDADFERCQFPLATFTRTRFVDVTKFSEATFTGDAWFGEATFTGYAGFDNATFTGDAWFGEATFTGYAWFGEATFTGYAWFKKATFTGDAWFGEATFTGHAGFHEATFTGHAGFEKATCDKTMKFIESRFAGHTDFTSLVLGRKATLSLEQSTAVLTPPTDAESEPEQHVWPQGWRLVPFPAGEGEKGWGRLEPAPEDASSDSAVPDVPSPRPPVAEQDTPVV